MYEGVFGRLRLAATSWPGVASLCLLALNDHYLKAAHPGYLTGKLSDFAGLFLVGLLAIAVVPRRRVVVGIVIAVAFVWWKSPASQPFIDFMPRLGLPSLARTVDYWDAMGLVMVPVAFRVWSRIATFQFCGPAMRRLIAVPLLAACALAIAATSEVDSYPWAFIHFGAKTTDEASTLDARSVRLAVETAVSPLGLACRNCDSGDASRRYERGRKIQLDYEIVGAGEVRFTIRYDATADLFLSDEERLARAVIDEVKLQLSRRFRDIAYVQYLDDRRQHRMDAEIVAATTPPRAVERIFRLGRAADRADGALDGERLWAVVDTATRPFGLLCADCELSGVAARYVRGTDLDMTYTIVDATVAEFTFRYFDDRAAFAETVADEIQLAFGQEFGGVRRANKTTRSDGQQSHIQ